MRLDDFDGEGRIGGVVATFADPGIIRLRSDGPGNSRSIHPSARQVS